MQVFSHGIKSQSLEFGENVTTIQEGAFAFCNNLSGDLVLANNITFIGYNAFNGCTGFSSITIGSSVTTIQSSAFNGINQSIIVNNSSAEGYPWGAV